MPGQLPLPVSHSQSHDLLAGSTLACAGWKQCPLPCCRCCSADLLSGLQSLAACLLDANMALPALPVLSMHEWVTRHVVQDAAATVGVRVQRVRALCQLGLPSQAVQLLSMLLKVQRTGAACVQGCANALSTTGLSRPLGVCTQQGRAPSQLGLPSQAVQLLRIYLRVRLR